MTDATGGHELSKTTGNAGGRVGCGNHLSMKSRFQLVVGQLICIYMHESDIGVICFAGIIGIQSLA